MTKSVAWLISFSICWVLIAQLFSETEVDRRVKAFLESHKGHWRDMNVPESDGQLLHDLIVKNEYRKALEIGTSTGHSSIWKARGTATTSGGGRRLGPR